MRRARLLFLSFQHLLLLSVFVDSFHTPPTTTRTECRRRHHTLHASSSSSQPAVPPLDPKALGLLALTGGVVGPAVDGIHNSVLLAYDLFPVRPFGLFSTSLLIPPLLAVAYALLGGVLPNILNRFLGDEEEASSSSSSSSSSSPLLPLVRLPSAGLQAAAAVASTVAVIRLSVTLHETSLLAAAPPASAPALLAAAALVQWAALDGTRGSLALALLAAVGGPVAEIPLMAGPLAHAWHYLTPDYFPLAGVFPAAATPEAGLEVITGPCYFAVTTDAIALYRFYYEFSVGEKGRRGGCKKNLIK